MCFRRAGARAIDLGGPKFEIMHKSRCLQKSKLVNWGAKHVDWGARLPGTPLAPALGFRIGDGARGSGPWAVRVAK